MKKLIPILLAMSALLNACNLASDENNLALDKSNTDGWNCIDTSTDFLYQMTEIGRNDRRYDISDVYPSQPWEMVVEMPETLFDAAMSSRFGTNVELARRYSEKTELWINNGRDLIRYKTDTEDFLVISPFPSDKNGRAYEDVYVLGLFEIADGSIIGINYPRENDTVWDENIPLLSIYNESKNIFQFYEIGLRYLSHEIEFRWEGLVPREGVIVKENKGTIWIYQQQDGLFSYDPISSELHHHEISFDRIVQRMVISPEGLILFSQEKEGSHWDLAPGELIQYNPVSQVAQKIKVPFFRWPDYGNMLYTDSGDLWIGIHGYLSKDETWILKNPRRRTYVNLGQESEWMNWSHPKLILQSSNGYLWYTNSTWDSLGINGSAWYDPTSETTCWFTTEPGNIVEDGQRTLWMVIENKIYRYELLDN